MAQSSTSSRYKKLYFTVNISSIGLTTSLIIIIWFQLFRIHNLFLKLTDNFVKKIVSFKFRVLLLCLGVCMHCGGGGGGDIHRY